MSTNFKYLDELISSGAKEIILDSDIILDDDEKSIYKEGIKIDVDDLIIDGNGHTIDAKGKRRIFKITGKNIFLKNLSLKNGHDDIGGAIYTNGDLTIIGSTLTGNTAGWSGGAIFNYHATLIIMDSTITENSLDGDGGAIYNSEGTLTVADSVITGNTAKKEGGAIFNEEGTLTIRESTLSGNSASNGGAICSKGTLTITESILNKNTAAGSGGAIDNTGGELTITESTLTGNTAVGGGGAIINSGGHLTINKSVLNENIAQKHDRKTSDRAINDGIVSIIMDPLFDKISGEERGGAISNIDGELTITESILNKNTAGSGGAINNKGGELTVTDSALNENTAQIYGGAINNLESSCILNHCKLINNKSCREGGGVCNRGDYHNGLIEVKSIIICDSCDFYNNSSSNFGGAIWTNYYAKFYSCNFADNISKKEGNIIYFDAIFDITLSIENSFIKNNFTENTGIYLNKPSQISIQNTKISNVSSNHVIYNKNGILNISKLKFEYDDKQSIYNNNILWINDVEVEKFIESGPESVIKYKTGLNNEIRGFQYIEELINKNSEYTALDCDIIMKEHEQDYYEGGIELNQDNFIFDGQNHTIDANKLSRIFIITGNNITLKNIKFKNGFYFKNEFDELENGGGVIYSLPDTSVTIENCEFCENSSRNIAGCINNKGVMDIYETKFTNNFAQKLCGAIYNCKILNLDYCDFENNFAPGNGKFGDDSVYELDFYKKTGGTIVNKGNMSFNNCNFKKTKCYHVLISIGVYVVGYLSIVSLICIIPGFFGFLLCASFDETGYTILFLKILFLGTVTGITAYSSYKLVHNYAKKHGFDYY